MDGWMVEGGRRGWMFLKDGWINFKGYMDGLMDGY